MNIRCSNKWAKPVRPGFSRAEPTLYQTFTVRIGTVWSSCRMTCSPLGSVNCVNGTSRRAPVGWPVWSNSATMRLFSIPIPRLPIPRCPRLPDYPITKLPNSLRDMFSTRVPGDRRANAFSAALAEARARTALIDLTTSNPTSVGLDYPSDLLAPLADPAALHYAPSAFGLRDAREAIAETY